MQKYLWINIWNDRRKDKVTQHQQQGFNFLQSYTMSNYKKTLVELTDGLGMYKGSPTSWYIVIIPPSKNEVIRIRLSDHPSTKEEWVEGEISGLPNRRYSIVIFSKKSMPIQSNQNVVETNWRDYEVEGIPIFEKCFNRIYLKDTIQTLLDILKSIYDGKSPSTNNTPIQENKNKQYINTSKTIMKLNEEQLRKLIRESITMVVNEGFGVEPHRTNITCYGLNLEMSMNGEDIIVEYADENMWVLAIYCAKDKTWHIQENLDNDDTINNNEENIIDIGDTKSMPSALFNLSTYVSNKKNNIRR